jgi:enoyl-CoA hydratase/carnithine racemase
MAKYGVNLEAMEAATFERIGNVAVVTLNRPESANTLDTTMHRDVVACWDEINKNDGIRAAVVTAAGRFFCAGRDIKEYVGTYGADGQPKLRPIDDPEHEMFGVLCNHYPVDKPLIGGLNGPAAGGGVEIAILCDMLVMADDAYIADLHAKINVSGMVALNTFLPPMIGRELAMTDRRLTAAECHRWGFANYVVPKDQVRGKAIELAENAARMGPDSIAWLKRGSLELQKRSGNLHDDEWRARRRETILQQVALTKSDHDTLEGLNAFLERRTTTYERPVRTER